ncbi:MAG: hypothetical protein QOI74_3932 [Micromonosporaceae bacterium]|jgi:hypothetical protein|nr:hypothetical protein [Micromonosporaceae bacterium]MDT5036188.1 hypothetical protein [Micromonosporaceae bacterium]
MLTFYIGAIAFLAVMLTGGSPKRLAGVRIRHVWLLWAALADQILIISVIPDAQHTLLAGAHIASYVAAGVCLLLNRHLAGAWLLAAGGAANALVIVLNGGTMAASAHALRTSGRTATGDFDNSTVLPHPRLAWLGDVFATPSWLPGHTVFSSGDIAIWLGVVWFLWRTCRPRPAMSGSEPAAHSA